MAYAELGRWEMRGITEGTCDVRSDHGIIQLVVQLREEQRGESSVHLSHCRLASRMCTWSTLLKLYSSGYLIMSQLDRNAFKSCRDSSIPFDTAFVWRC